MNPPVVSRTRRPADDSNQWAHADGCEMYYRVFGTNASPVPPAALLEQIQHAGFAITGHFRGDAQGWFRADLVYPLADARIELERFLANEEGVRAELNTWAAWLENAKQVQWLQHMISTTQIVTIQPIIDEDAEVPVDDFCLALCRALARETAGIYQADGQGFFTADGKMIVAETPDS